VRKKIMLQKGTVPAIKILAQSMDLQVAEPALDRPIDTQADAAAQYWLQNGYSSANLSDNIPALTRQLLKDLPPGIMRTVYLSFKLALESIDGTDWADIRKFPLQTLRQSGQTEMADFIANYKDSAHAIALVILEQGIILCDANCGIYQIQWGNEAAFFNQYEECYKTFGSDPEGPELVFRPELTGIFKIVLTRPAASANQ
jgi:hypothetical protein